ncbi:CRISPR system precrRNA processing endoribonuclease RAMP protein Cas6 [uncultured Oscillibacter sp.]|uniref:CRISPR system precrRNA processing endoribonuclease RAMP protein Cas6 n=1 Tax=uncultured Oscillibacter sp. TaxID=876091 RepID=UPI00280620D8|nr:CRISPR system precrRNA processing endoribonuclease RAMP protein Cas6 [uncultured Oscillibacter sp.]
MMTRYRLALTPDHPCNPRPEWAYRLYAALLAQAPGAFGAEAHQDGATPVSQHLTLEEGKLIWTVGLLGADCEEKLSSVLEQLHQLRLEKDRVTLAVERRERRTVADAEELLDLAARERGLHTLRFVTATAFKSQGRYLNLPSTHLIIQSLVKKWNGCIRECPIEDTDGQGAEALAAGLRLRAFRLYDRMYYLKGSSIPGFVGELTLENRLEGFQRQLADALLLFADHAGVGIKTTLGMGGVEHQTE